MSELPKRKRLQSLEHQEGGTHYQRFNIQPLEFMAMNRLPFIEGNIIKYVCRHRHKNGLEDLLKAKHYLEVLIETEYEVDEILADMAIDVSRICDSSIYTAKLKGDYDQPQCEPTEQCDGENAQ